jgi:hypothetical protein
MLRFLLFAYFAYFAVQRTLEKQNPHPTDARSAADHSSNAGTR